MSVVREPETPRERNHRSGCCKILKVRDTCILIVDSHYAIFFQRKAKRAYAILASYRPVRGTTVSVSAILLSLGIQHHSCDYGIPYTHVCTKTTIKDTLL